MRNGIYGCKNLKIFVFFENMVLELIKFFGDVFVSESLKVFGRGG